jgi:glycosyltransferase involved in cell wall biosynthesis
LLLEAFGRVARSRPDLILVHTGHVSHRIDVEALARAAQVSGRVRLLGYLPNEMDVLRLMRGAAVLVQPGAPTAFNRYRLPSKLPEYLLSGRPVVTFATGAGALLKNGVHALLTETGEAEELAEKLVRVLDDPRLAERLGAAGRLRALELFDPQRNCDALLDLYAEVLAPPRDRVVAGGDAASSTV